MGTDGFLVVLCIILENNRRHLVNWSAPLPIKSEFFKIDMVSAKFTSKLKSLNQSVESLGVGEVGIASVTNRPQKAGTLPTIWWTSAAFVHITDNSGIYPTFSPPSIIQDLSLTFCRASFNALQAPCQVPADAMHIVEFPLTNHWSVADYLLITSLHIVG